MTVSAQNAKTTAQITQSARVQMTPASRGIRWQIAEGCTAVVTGESAPDWFGLGDSSVATLVKRNPVREVYRVELSQGVFFAKVFRHDTLLTTVKRWFAGPPAIREFRGARALDRAGVGAIRAVAAGIYASGNRSVLVSEELHDARTLAELAADSPSPSAGLIEAVARFLARTHAADILPRDTHSENLLVRPRSGPDDWEIALSDLAGIRVGRTVNENDVARNIAELLQWFRPRITVTQRLRFLRAYLHERHVDERSDRKRIARLVEIAAAAHERKLWAKRDRRILRTNAFFARTEAGDQCRAYLVLRCRSRDRLSVPFEGVRTVIQWQAWLRQHLPELQAAGLPDDLHLRHECAGRWRGLWWALAGGSPSRRSFVLAHALRHRDLSALHTPALFERRALGKSAHSVLMVYRPAASESLRATVSRLLGGAARIPCANHGNADRRQLRLVLRATGELLADMVRRGVTARQLTVDTFVVLPDGDTGPLVCIGDFRGLTVRRRPVSAAVAWLPACLLQSCPVGVTHTDYLRLLLPYWRRLPRQLRSGDWKSLWRWIEALATG